MAMVIVSSLLLFSLLLFLLFLLLGGSEQLLVIGPAEACDREHDREDGQENPFQDEVRQTGSSDPGILILSRGAMADGGQRER